MKADAKKTKEENLTVEQKVRREVVAWFWIVLIFLLINGTVGQARVIPSGSMENTLLIGDHLVMSRLGYDAGIPFTRWHVPLWKNPVRGQMIIFSPPFNPGGEDLIKRVIGMPGDTVDVRDGQVWINGKALEENYTFGKTERVMEAGGVPLPFHVPENCYFAMGDNREHSYDSRYWGCVPRANIIGTPVMIYMSIDAPPDSWDSGQIRERVFAYVNAVLHPGTIRWRRLFHTF